MNNTTELRRPKGWHQRLVLAVQRRWDWWIYCRAVHSLRRMTIQNPGMSYLMELQIRRWNEQLNISPELRRSTEVFHAAMNDHRQNVRG